MWFYTYASELSKMVVHEGPPLNVDKKHIKAFKATWKGHKIFKSSEMGYTVQVHRKYVRLEKLGKDLELKKDAESLRLKRFLSMPDLSRTPGSPINEIW